MAWLTFFPRLVLTIIALLSAVLVLKGLRKERDENETVAPAVFLTAVIIAVAGALVSYAGTLLTLFLVAIVLPIAWGERRLHLVAALAVALPAAVYLVFSLAFGIRFPAGRLFQGLM